LLPAPFRRSASLKGGNKGRAKARKQDKTI
jgi:hypothetical protein